MKKFLTFYMVGCLTISLYSNTDCSKKLNFNTPINFIDSIPLKDRSWFVDYYHNFPDYEESIRKYYFIDSVKFFNGRVYHELVSDIYNNPNVIRRTNDYFRIEGNKLIYLYQQLTEVVFEDFDLHVGDTIFMDREIWLGKNHIISKIDTVTYLDGKPRVRHSFYCGDELNTEPTYFLNYIQGLSTPEGLFNQDNFCTLLDKPYHAKIRCYYENDKLVYTAPGIGIDSCFIRVGIQDEQNGKLSISPNPASTYIGIQHSNECICLYYMKLHLYPVSE